MLQSFSVSEIFHELKANRRSAKLITRKCSRGGLLHTHKRNWIYNWNR